MHFRALCHPAGALAAAALATARFGVSCDSAEPSADAKAQLRLVQVVFRHGARTPLTENYWGDARWERDSDCKQAFEAVQISLRSASGGQPPESKWDKKQMSTVWPGGCRKGELTTGGQLQARDLGAWLRQRYVKQAKFLPADYQEGVVFGRTTNFARTRATLQAVLTGLYPGTLGPVPVTTSGDMDEILIASAHSCERLGDLLKLQAQRVREEAGKDRKIQNLDKQVKQVMGLLDDHSIAYTDLYDALTTLQYHKKPVPEGLTPELYRAVEDEALRRMAAIVSPRPTEQHGPDIMRLGMGQLFQQITERMDAEAHGAAQGSRIYMYSGHDTTVMPLLVTLGDKMKRWPGYLSNIIFELWQLPGAEGKAGEYVVRVLYNQEDMPLGDSSLGSGMSLEDFKEKYFRPFLLTREEYGPSCKIKVQHHASAQAAAIGGDSVQGL